STSRILHIFNRDIDSASWRTSCFVCVPGSACFGFCFHTDTSWACCLLQSPSTQVVVSRKRSRCQSRTKRKVHDVEKRKSLAPAMSPILVRRCSRPLSNVSRRANYGGNRQYRGHSDGSVRGGGEWGEGDHHQHRDRTDY